MKLSYGDVIERFLGRPGLDRKARHLCWVAALLAMGEEEALREAVIEAIDDDVPPGAIMESILQSYLFVGYPRAINGLHILRETCRASGLDYPAGTDIDEDYPCWEAWQRRGERLCRLVYGDRYERLIEKIRGLHPLLARWMIIEGYGKVLGRGGLPIKERELLVISVLTVQGAWRQLRSHLAGGLHAGASRVELEEAIRQLGPFLREDRIETALSCLVEEMGPKGS